MHNTIVITNNRVLKSTVLLILILLAVNVYNLYQLHTQFQTINNVPTVEMQLGTSEMAQQKYTTLPYVDSEEDLDLDLSDSEI